MSRARREQCHAAHRAFLDCLMDRRELARDFSRDERGNLREPDAKGALIGPPKGHDCRAAWEAFAESGTCMGSWVVHFERQRVAGSFRDNEAKLREKERRENAKLRK
jgi:Cytochrome oxidase c subunit VIb